MKIKKIKKQRLELEIINQTQFKIPKKDLKNWINWVWEILISRDVTLPHVNMLVCVFLDEKEVKKLNLKYRNKDKTTDVLSFSPVEPGSLGELIFDPKKILKQSRENKHSFRSELRYLALHGLLHLLGFDHEKGGREEEVMMTLQDNIWQTSFDLFKKSMMEMNKK